MKFRVSAKLNSVIEIEKDFLVNDVKLLNVNGSKIAQIVVEADTLMDAQAKANNEFQKTFGAIALIAKHHVEFIINDVTQITPKEEIKSATNEIVAMVTVPRYLNDSEITKANEILNLVQKYPIIEKVFNYINRSDYYTWITMYKVYEIIDKDINIKNKQWISSKNRNLFTRTANHPVASGVDARHGVQKEEPPEVPMVLDEAKELIDNLVSRWIDYYRNK